MQSLSDLPFIGGHAALDFVNTAEERGHPDAGDVLRAPADLRVWGRRYGLLAAHTGGEERAEWRRALEARELLYALFRARVRERPPARADLDRLASFAAAAYRAAALEREADGRLAWRWDPGRLSTVRHVAVTTAIDLLSGEPGPRLKQCPGEHCGWFFLDTTKRGNRRWCSMSECGQDAKLVRRRTRQQRGDRRGHV